MIKLDVVLFLGGICAVILGVVLVETEIGALMLATGALMVIGAPVVTLVMRLDGDRSST